jgi:RNA polymerase sigma-70 factor (ECF subfamily)
MPGSMIPEPIPDKVLIEHLRSGSQKALHELYVRYSRPVYLTALRITDSPQDAEDVLQDLFVALPEAIQSYEGRGSFEGWIRRVAVRMALMRLRSAYRHREVPHGTRPVAAREGEALPNGSDSVDTVSLERALAQLPAADRVVLVLKEIEGYSHAEIGALLGITKTASASRLFRAKRELRELLERKE